jgi:hypothetical protein
LTAEKPVEELSDDEVLALAELRFASERGERLSGLLERNREGRSTRTASVNWMR